jgi:hypothetical protein
MKLTNNSQKADAIADAYTQRTKAREHYATLADAGDEHARDDIRRIDRELGKLRAEALKLKDERAGNSDPAAVEARRYHGAVEHTAAVERGFFADLGRLGWYQQPSPEVRREIEERASRSVRDSFGEYAARHCSRLLGPTPSAAAAGEGPLSVPVVPQ